MSARRAHVLMTTDVVGGVWTYALDLGRGLVRAGVQVSLAVLGPDPDDAQHGQARDAGLQLFDLGGALDWTATNAAEVAASAQALADLADRLRPDLIHLNSPALAGFGPLGAPVLAACHSCVKTWWAAVKGSAPLPPGLAWRAELVARGYDAADALLTPSRAFAHATRRAYGLAEAPHVVRNGSAKALPLGGEGSGGGAAPPPEGWRIEPRKNDQPAVLHPRPCPCPSPFPIKGEGLQTTAILTAGRLWDAGKDVATLDRAAGRLVDADVAAAGPASGPNGEAVTLAHVRALGQLSGADLKSRLAQRPVFVSPSLYEPFGLAVLEAAQAGCPLVLSGIATFRELWDEAAVFFPPGDDAALAGVLGDLAADPNRRATLGAAARTRAARYTAEAMTHATLQLYATLSPAFALTEAMA